MRGAIISRDKICFWVILALLAVNVLLSGRSAIETIRTAYRVRGMTNAQRLMLIWGPYYQQLLTIQSIIPKRASIRWVSDQPPWYVAYYLYPRLLRPGASSLQELDVVRRRFPAEWVLSLSTGEGRHFSVYGPSLPPKGPH